eukprot:11765375-Ditylum_brightwellii.AAC.1
MLMPGMVTQRFFTHSKLEEVLTAHHLVLLFAQGLWPTQLMKVEPIVICVMCQGVNKKCSFLDGQNSQEQPEDCFASQSPWIRCFLDGFSYVSIWHTKF